MCHALLYCTVLYCTVLYWSYCLFIDEKYVPNIHHEQIQNNSAMDYRKPSTERLSGPSKRRSKKQGKRRLKVKGDLGRYIKHRDKEKCV